MKKILVSLMIGLLTISCYALEYVTDSKDGIVIQNGDTPFPEESVFPVPEMVHKLPVKYFKINITTVTNIIEKLGIVNNVITTTYVTNYTYVRTVVEKTADEKRIIDLPAKYRKYENNQWIEFNQEEKDAVDKAEADAIIAAQVAEELAFENNKSQVLKILENVYCDFLSRQWTTSLHTYNIVSNDVTITESNTTEIQNITYLLTLRAINWEVYGQMAGEFDRLKTAIKDNGGRMDRVKKH